MPLDAAGALDYINKYKQKPIFVLKYAAKITAVNKSPLTQSTGSKYH